MMTLLFIISVAPAIVNAIIQILIRNTSYFKKYYKIDIRTFVLLARYGTLYMNSVLNGFAYARFIPEFRQFVRSCFCWKRMLDAESVEKKLK